MTTAQGKPRDRGVRSRGRILDAAERLMAARGYSGTSISSICQDTGLPPTSIYHHFGNKQQLLAAVMDRGAQRWFESLPSWGHLADSSGAEGLVAEAADAVRGNPLFLRLFYLLSLDAETDSEAAQLIATVRSSAFRYFETVIANLLSADYPSDVAHAAAIRLAPFAVAVSDGCFFSLQLEPDRSDLRQLYADLALAIRAMAPQIISALTIPEEKD